VINWMLEKAGWNPRHIRVRTAGPACAEPGSSRMAAPLQTSPRSSRREAASLLMPGKKEPRPDLASLRRQSRTIPLPGQRAFSVWAGQRSTRWMWTAVEESLRTGFRTLWPG